MNMPLSPSASTAQPPSVNGPLPKRVRATGWILILLGVGLSVGMALCASSLLHTVVHDREFGGNPHWHGSPEFTRTTFELFGSIFFLGLLIVGGGIYQVRAGRRHPVLIALTLLLAGAIVYLTMSIISATPTPP